MPYINEHAARVADPSSFAKDSIRRKNIAKGVDMIMGMKNGRMMPQSYRFNADMFSSDKAREWLQSNGIKYVAFEKATGMMQSFVSLVAMQLQAFSNVDILALIPKDILDAIRLKDANPFFQAYSICHEGISTPTILGDTAKPIHWTRAAVQSIKNTVLKGLKFFSGHNADNSVNNRESLGEIVADVQQEIDGVLHQIVVGYFPDKSKVADKDICSQEADWNFFEAAGQWFADTLDKVTGIALSNSAIDKPAFSGAKRLGMLQAFDELKKTKGRVKGMSDIDLSTISADSIKAEIARRQMVPSEIFNLDAIAKDRVFHSVFDENTALKTQIKDKDILLSQTKAEKDAAAKISAQATAKSRMEKIIETMPMPDRMRVYVKDSFNDNVSDLTDEGLQKFVESQVNVYKNVAKSMGVKEEIPQSREQVHSDSSIDENDLTKAANNPLLEEDMSTI